MLGLALGVALLLPAPAMLAASTAPGPAAPAATPARAQRPPLSDGEIRKIDPDRRRVTLRHGELPHLQMPPMTMSFRVAEPPRLKGLKPGDRVRFVAAMEGDELVVLRIERAR